MEYYEVLGVIPSAEPSVIKAAYKALVSMYHPDKNSDPNAEIRIRQINEAYEVLSHLEKRNSYDKSRENIQHDASEVIFSTDNPFKEEDPLDKDWSIAAGFYPLIKGQFENLSQISWRLAFAFRL